LVKGSKYHTITEAALTSGSFTSATLTATYMFLPEYPLKVQDGKSLVDGQLLPTQEHLLSGVSEEG